MNYFKNSPKKKIILEVVLVIVLSIISVLPGFINYYNVSMDGAFHLGRFANIAQSFKSGGLPSIFNFQYAPINSYPGVAINAMYPWFTGMIFIIPQSLLSNQFLGLAIGYFLLNVLTIINSYCLMNEFTKKHFYIWLGVIIYQFNNFHFIDLYSRSAFGEAMGLAWIPLVLLGIIRIHKNKKTVHGF